MVNKAVLTRREALAAAIAGVGTIAGCLGDADPDAIENGDDDDVEVDDDAVELFIQAGPDGTSFQAISAPFGQAVRSYSENPPIDATVSSSGGGVENVRVLFQGETDVATTDGVSSYNAMNGNDPFDDPKPVKWLARAALGQRFYAVREDSDIEDIADLEGARVAPGPAGSGGYTQHEEIMETLGIEVDNASLEHSEGGSALRDGQVDAWYIFNGSDFQSTWATADIRLLSFTEDELETYQEISPATEPATVDDEWVEGLEEEILAIGINTGWVVRDDMDDEIAYELARVAGEHPEDIANNFIGAQFLDAEFAYNEFFTDEVGLEYHDGALEYYEDAGVL